MYTYDEVIDALNDLEERNPKILNIPMEGEEIVGLDEIIDSDNSALHVVDKMQYKEDMMSKDCLLRCKQESTEVRQILKEHCRNSKYVKTSAEYELCFYKAILISIHDFISKLDNFREYTALHLKYQILNFII